MSNANISKTVVPPGADGSPAPLFLTACLDGGEVDGPYAGMMADYEQRHRDYCARHSYVYYSYEQIPSAHPYWFKLQLIVAALNDKNYTHVFWLDVDTIVLNTAVDMRDALPPWAWLGATIHPYAGGQDVWHLQSGALYIRSCPEALAFFERALSFKGTGQYLCDQDAMHGLIYDKPDYQKGLVILPYLWNNTLHDQPASPNSVVVAFHGNGSPAERRGRMRQYAQTCLREPVNKKEPIWSYVITEANDTSDQAAPEPVVSVPPKTVPEALAAQDYDAALAILREITERNPYEVNAYKDMHSLLSRKEDHIGIVQAFRKAVAVDPNDLQLHFALANAYDAMGDFERAEMHYDTALDIDPHCNLIRTFRAYFLLKRGWNCASSPERNKIAERNWKKGLEDYELACYIPQHPAKRALRTQVPMWNGEPIPGRRLYVTYEQGYGDGIWIARWFKLLKERSQATVIVECPLSLMRLYERIEGIDLLVPMRDLNMSGFSTSWDEHIPMLSLLRVLGVGPASLQPTNYLTVDEPEKIEGDGLKVGFCWQGSKSHSADSIRSIPWETIKHLTKIEGVVPVSLQHSDDNLPNPLTGDFLATARRVAACDLVVTVDSSVAHIAGALGVPCVMLMATVGDWRWFLETDETPWYPTVSIIRQNDAGDWQPAFIAASQHIKSAVKSTALTPIGATEEILLRPFMSRVAMNQRQTNDQMDAGQHPL